MFTLITGASSGIGLELAKICAQAKENLILVARSKENLEQLAKELRENSSIEVIVIAKDLSQPSSPFELYEEIKRRELRVNAIINNAGFGDYGPFVKSEWNKQSEMIQLNVMCLTHLTHLFLPSMIERGHGKIMNVASTASFFPGPFMAVYYATKSFVLSFSEALSEELSGTGVSVTALCPGPTTSGFQQTANMTGIPVLKMLQIPSSKVVADFGYKAMMSGERVAVHGAFNKVAIQTARLTPRSLVLKLMRRLQEKR